MKSVMETHPRVLLDFYSCGLRVTYTAYDYLDHAL